MAYLRITLPAADRQAWLAGRLHRRWAAQFPELFDADDLRLAETQHPHGSHYVEWAAAIAMRRRFGWLALVEKYEFPAQHPAKAAVLARLGIAIVRNPHCQHPDLLLYRPDGQWQFLEVKTKTDALSPAQRLHFPAIQARHGVPLDIMRVLEK